MSRQSIKKDYEGCRMKHKDTLGYEFREINHLIGSRCGCRDRQHGQKLPRMQAWTIGFLYDRQDREMFQKDVEAEFAISRATATHMLQALEQKGMIQRVPVERDKRLKRIVLTDKAIVEHQLVMHNVDELERNFIRGFSEQERGELLRLLRKVHNNLEELNS